MVSYFVTVFFVHASLSFILSKTAVVYHRCIHSGFCFRLIVMSRFTQPITSFKIRRLLLPSAVLIAGVTIFICGMVRSYHITKLTKGSFDKNFVKNQDDQTTWWIGFPLIGTAVLAISAVLVDKPLLYKLSVFMTGFCVVISIYAIFWDAGEFSTIAQRKHMKRFLESEGHICETFDVNYTYKNQSYTVHWCQCDKDDKTNYEFYSPGSCEMLDGLYYVHAVLAFAMACGIGFCMFTSISFVLILKRISQITTALHLDEKPLSEDFGNIAGDLYIES